MPLYHIQRTRMFGGTLEQLPFNAWYDAMREFQRQCLHAGAAEQMMDRARAERMEAGRSITAETWNYFATIGKQTVIFSREN